MINQIKEYGIFKTEIENQLNLPPFFPLEKICWTGRIKCGNVIDDIYIPDNKYTNFLLFLSDNDKNIIFNEYLSNTYSLHINIQYNEDENYINEDIITMYEVLKKFIEKKLYFASNESINTVKNNILESYSFVMSKPDKICYKFVFKSFLVSNIDTDSIIKELSILKGNIVRTANNILFGHINISDNESINQSKLEFYKIFNIIDGKLESRDIQAKKKFIKWIKIVSSSVKCASPEEPLFSNINNIYSYTTKNDFILNCFNFDTVDNIRITLGNIIFKYSKNNFIDLTKAKFVVKRGRKMDKTKQTYCLEFKDRYKCPSCNRTHSDIVFRSLGLYLKCQVSGVNSNKIVSPYIEFTKEESKIFAKEEITTDNIQGDIIKNLDIIKDKLDKGIKILKNKFCNNAFMSKKDIVERFKYININIEFKQKEVKKFEKIEYNALNNDNANDGFSNDTLINDNIAVIDDKNESEEKNINIITNNYSGFNHIISEYSNSLDNIDIDDMTNNINDDNLSDMFMEKLNIKKRKIDMIDIKETNKKVKIHYCLYRNYAHDTLSKKFSVNLKNYLKLIGKNTFLHKIYIGALLTILTEKFNNKKIIFYRNWFHFISFILANINEYETIYNNICCVENTEGIITLIPSLRRIISSIDFDTLDQYGEQLEKSNINDVFILSKLYAFALVISIGQKVIISKYKDNIMNYYKEKYRDILEGNSSIKYNDEYVKINVTDIQSPISLC